MLELYICIKKIAYLSQITETKVLLLITFAKN